MPSTNCWIGTSGPACAKANVSFDKLTGIVGDHHSGILWGCVFKDLLARDLDDGRNRRRLSEAERLERECLQQSVHGTAVCSHQRISLQHGAVFAPTRVRCCRDASWQYMPVSAKADAKC